MDDELATGLEQAVAAATELLGARGCGVMFADAEHELRYAAATDPESERLEKAQRDTGHGPCVDALVHDEIVTTRDVTADERYAALREALGATSIRAVLGTPIHLAGAAVGSIDLYRDHAHDWTEDEVRSMRTYAALIETYLVAALRAERQERLATQLQHALDNRVVIERAVGVLMAQRGLDPVDAFDVLRRNARRRRIRVAELAETLVAGEVLES